MRSQHFPVLIEIDENGVFIVSCPSFRGCHSFGATIDEALANIREAIELCLEEEVSPAPTTFVGIRDIEVAAYA
ncbi:MAG: type II toxin-antitoxin system HicB family antitoxin [Candidatus Kapaibacterium sp.]|nr:MAG: type II toxin-antitoxin system HicB family antitoxin [Candidatus Kapabacteria bacterium]